MSWLESRKVRICLLVGFLWTLIFLLSMVVMNQDHEKARPTDFVCVHGASIVLVNKEPWKCYDHEEVFQAISEVDWPKAQGYWPWLYPPTALFFIWPLGWLSYGWAQIAWFMAQFLMMIGAYRLILGHGRSLGGILGYPGVAINVSYGQNGLFSGGMVGIGFFLLADYPAIAGAVLSLVACKPHLSLLIPLALVAGKERRAFWGFVGFALLWHAASVWAFGWASWELWVYQAFAHVEWYADSGLTLPLEVVPSVYGAACMRWEQSLIPLILQAYVGLTAVLTMMSVWWRDRRIESRIVTLVSATLLASPKVVTYDLLATLPMLAFWVSKDGDEAPSTSDCWLLAVTWLLPTICEPIARWTFFQITPLLLLLWLWRVERYSRTEEAMAPSPWGA